MNKKKRLSAKPYMMNNKTRIGVLVISFALFITMIYGIGFLFSITTTTFHNLIVEQREKAPTVILKFPEEMTINEYSKNCLSVCNLLSAKEGVKAAIPSASYYGAHVNAVIGHMRFEIKLMDEAYIDLYLTQYDAKLIEGHIPSKPGELIMNENYKRNNDLRIGDSPMEGYTIVGTVDCEGYLFAGINQYFIESTCTVFLDSSADIYQICESLSLPYDYAIDGPMEGEKDYQNNVDSSISFSSRLITIIATTLVFICLLVVIQMHFRDRKEEWCLYNSLGYSLFDIYHLAMKELLFSILYAIILGTILVSSLMVVVNQLLVVPRGLLVHFYLPETLLSILSILIFFIGCCQLPLMLSLHQIKTVDALESESI